MHLDPFCQAASEWKAANKSGDLLSEIRWLAALNRHLAHRWGHLNPGPAPWSADSDRHGNPIRLERGRNRMSRLWIFGCGRSRDRSGWRTPPGPSQGWIRYQRNSLLCRQSDLVILIYYWINKRYPQLSNFGDSGYKPIIAIICTFRLLILNFSSTFKDSFKAIRNFCEAQI